MSEAGYHRLPPNSWLLATQSRVLWLGFSCPIVAKMKSRKVILANAVLHFLFVFPVFNIPLPTHCFFPSGSVTW